MKCFNHSETEAVGICKQCHKGLCPLCLTETTGGIACASTCVNDVESVDRVIRKNVGASRSKALLITPVFLFLIGASFIYRASQDTGRLSWLIFMGVLMALWGGITFLAVLKKLDGNK